MGSDDLLLWDTENLDIDDLLMLGRDGLLMWDTDGLLIRDTEKLDRDGVLIWNTQKLDRDRLLIWHTEKLDRYGLLIWDTKDTERTWQKTEEEVLAGGKWRKRASLKEVWMLGLEVGTGWSRRWSMVYTTLLGLYSTKMISDFKAKLDKSIETGEYIHNSYDVCHKFVNTTKQIHTGTHQRHGTA